MKKTVKINGMSCEHCSAHVKNALLAVDGVVSATVSLETKTAIIETNYDVADEAIIAAVDEAGYDVTGIA